MKKLLLILLCFPLLLFSKEEKRLALVIGNANYDKGELKNPVNDALLIAETLKQLDFDVILDTNIISKEGFIRTIRKFGNKRSDYDVGFVYYAGHGIQVGSENFLLPTKVNFQTEYDVIDFGVSVQNIMRYLTGMTNQVNILVLDACRDNPFEGNWNNTRSLKGQGLAKIPPPTGSLIAFSTDAGNTAADGDGENSIYCESLCKNMMLKNTSLDQVFRNVRSDVLSHTNGNQRPVESSQLTGSVYYLNDFDISFISNKIDQLISEDDLDQAMVLCNFLIFHSPETGIGFVKRAHVYYLMEYYDLSFNDYNKSLEIDELNVEAYYYVINENTVGLIELCLDNQADWNLEKESSFLKQKLEMIREKDPQNFILDLVYADLIFDWHDQKEEPLQIFKNALNECKTGNDNFYVQKHHAFKNFNCEIFINYSISKIYASMNDYQNANIYSNSIILDLENNSSIKNWKKAYIYQQKGNIEFGLENYTNAEAHYRKAISLNKSDIMNYIKISDIYYKKSRYDSVISILDKAIRISFENDSWLDISYSYFLKAMHYEEQEKLILAYDSYSEAISFAKKSNNFRYQRSFVLNKLAQELPLKSSSFLKLMCIDLKFICDNKGNGWDCQDYNQYCK
tara:strand:- start:9484 stop:11358 length:1875 start_codon:yes stop_codon:yes gene_type:complete